MDAASAEDFLSLTLLTMMIYNTTLNSHTVECCEFLGLSSEIIRKIRFLFHYVVRVCYKVGSIHCTFIKAHKLLM